MASSATAVTWTYLAFGLAFDADFAMPGLPATPVDRDARSSTLRRLSPFDVADAGRIIEGHTIYERQFAETVFTVTVAADQSVQALSTAHGDFRVAADGSCVLCIVDDDGTWQWRRFLIGQVLPFAALLSGLEPIHASAVALDGAVVVVAGPSHVGKTSIATHLVLSGASLVADDVVAIEHVGDEVRAHPSLGLLGIRHAECERIGDVRLAALGPVIASDEKEQLIAVPRIGEPLPVHSVYLPEHTGRTGGEVEFVACRDPRFLLAATYSNVWKPPERLLSMLDVYSAVSRGADVYRVRVPVSVDAAQLADAIGNHHETTRC